MYRLLAILTVSVFLVAGCGLGPRGDLEALKRDCMATVGIEGTTAGGTALETDRTEQRGRTIPAGLVRSLPLVPEANEAEVVTNARGLAASCGWVFAEADSGTRAQATKTVDGDPLRLSLAIQGDPTGRFLVVNLSNQAS